MCVCVCVCVSVRVFFPTSLCGVLVFGSVSRRLLLLLRPPPPAACPHTACPHTHTTCPHNLLTHNFSSHNFSSHNLSTHNLSSHNLSTFTLRGRLALGWLRWSAWAQFFISHLASWLRTRRFSEPTFRPSGAPNHWQNTVFRDFPTFSRICIFCLLTLSLLLFFLLIFLFSLPLPCSAFHLSILSEV